MNVYTVEIKYREPEYESRHGAREKPYRWTYRVTAGDADLAAGLALSEFRYIAAISSVCWTREVVAVTVERADSACSLAAATSA